MGSSSSKQKASPQQREPTKKKESAAITNSDRVRLQLKVQRDSLVASIRKYERVGQSEHEKAKEFMKAGNKRRAVYCLKRERMQQDQIKTVTDILDNVQKLIDSVEFAQIENEVVAALSDGKSELDRLNKMLNLDDIEKLMNETAESVEMAQQIDFVLSQPLFNNIDNDDLLAELKAHMEAEQSPPQLSDVTVPSHKMPASNTKGTEEDVGDEGRALEAA